MTEATAVTSLIHFSISSGVIIKILLLTDRDYLTEHYQTSYAVALCRVILEIFRCHESIDSQHVTKHGGEGGIRTPGAY